MLSLGGFVLFAVSPQKAEKSFQAFSKRLVWKRRSAPTFVAGRRMGLR